MNLLTAIVLECNMKSFESVRINQKERGDKMATFKSKDDKGMVVECKCGCDEGIRIKIEKEEDYYAVLTYVSGHFYTEQDGFLKRFALKLKKIIAIIRNKDFYYSEVIISKDDFKEFKEFVNMH